MLSTVAIDGSAKTPHLDCEHLHASRHPTGGGTVAWVDIDLSALSIQATDGDGLSLALSALGPIGIGSVW